MRRLCHSMMCRRLRLAVAWQRPTAAAVSSSWRRPLALAPLQRLAPAVPSLDCARVQVAAS